MALDRDRDYLGDPTNVACAACNQSGRPIRNALCEECSKIHWFCCVCGRILDRDTDLVCTCGFALENLEERLRQIEEEEAREKVRKAAKLDAEEKLWHRRFGLVLAIAGLVLAAIGTLAFAGIAVWICVGLGGVLLTWGVCRFVKGV